MQPRYGDWVIIEKHEDSPYTLWLCERDDGQWTVVAYNNGQVSNLAPKNTLYASATRGGIEYVGRLMNEKMARSQFEATVSQWRLK